MDVALVSVDSRHGLRLVAGYWKAFSVPWLMEVSLNGRLMGTLTPNGVLLPVACVRSYASFLLGGCLDVCILFLLAKLTLSARQ